MEQSTDITQTAQETINLPNAAQPLSQQVSGEDRSEGFEGQATAGTVHEERDESSTLVRMNSLWQQVKASGDFYDWVSVIKMAEQLDNIETLREVYDGFLQEYPLCFGYWKKYAEAELRHSAPEQARVVYERGVAAVPYSVDIWAHYCCHRIDAGANQQEVEGLFEKAVAYVGADYHAHGLWDKYLRYEHAISNTPLMAQLYTRILTLPIRDLDRYHSEFVAYARDHTASELASAEEAAEIRNELEAALRAALESARVKKRAAVNAATDSARRLDQQNTEDAIMLDALDAQPVNEGTDIHHTEIIERTHLQKKPADTKELDIAGSEEEYLARQIVTAAFHQVILSDAAGLGRKDQHNIEPIIIPDITDADIKRQWVSRREASFKMAKIEAMKRQSYEAAIRRPYFHIKPLDPVQLSAWSNFLDFSESQSDDAATVRLYERCLVACAQYPEFWIRYISYLDRKGEKERAQDAFARATNQFCKRSPQIFLFAARRHELQQFADGVNHSEEAREAYNKVASHLAPGMVQCTVQRANFERRQGNVQEAHRLFEDHIAMARAQLGGSTDNFPTGAQLELNRKNSHKTLDDDSSHDAAGVYAFLVIQYAHFLQTVLNNTVQARQLYQKALLGAPHIKSLWEGAIHFEMVDRAADYVKKVLDLYEQATAPPPPPPAFKEAATATLFDSQQQQQHATGEAENVKGSTVIESSAACAESAMQSLEATNCEVPTDRTGNTLREENGVSVVSKGLSRKEREELSERMVAFADLHGTVADLQRAQGLHFERFRLPLALADRKRALHGAEGQPGAKKATTAVHGSSDAELIGSQPASTADGTTSISYYGSAGFSAYNYGGYYGGYPGYGYY